jgi:Uncharacterised protein family (UPF0158)
MGCGIYHLYTLPNGKSIDIDQLALAMEDSDLGNSYFLNLSTGELAFFSDFLGLTEEDEHLLDEIEGSDDYVAVERIPSYVAYQWMVDFVDEVVTPVDEHAADRLARSLHGKGAFRRFKDTLYYVDDRWQPAWYEWRDKKLNTAAQEWLKSVL